jgi:cytoskeletal protein RodZ
MASFGEELRRERELRQVSLREVSEATKINLRYLEALEKNNFEHLPGGVFNRGFVRAYSQFIGIDPDAMVNAYRLEEQAQASRGKAKDRDSFHRPWKRADAETDRGVETVEGERGFRTLILWIVIAVVATGIVAGALLAYDHFKSGEPAAETGDVPGIPETGADGEQP